MEKLCLSYRNIRGYRYQVMDKFSIDVSGFFGSERLCISGFAYLENGSLRVSKGYAWDGPSGPVIHTKNWLKPSLVHDVFYQLIRNGFFPDPEKARAKADDLMLSMLRAEGMSRFRSWYSWKAVRIFGKKAVRASERRDVLRVCSPWGVRP